MSATIDRQQISDTIAPFIEAIDEHRVEQGETSWTAYIFGAHAVCGDWWLQISSDVHQYASLLLRVPANAVVEDAVATLELWRPGVGHALTTLTVPLPHVGGCIPYASPQS